MGACSDITKLNSTHINPALASPAKLKADIGLSVQLIKASMPIKSSGRIVPPGWAPLQPKQSVLSLIV